MQRGSSWVSLGVLLLLLLLPGCRGQDNRPAEPEDASPGIPSPTSATRYVPSGKDEGDPLPEPAGPFADATWPAGELPAGNLLHDDGQTLWTIDPHTAERTALWEHPPTRVLHVAAAADRQQVALVVAHGDHDVLYLAQPDGSVLTVTVSERYEMINTPVFIRPPGGGGRVSPPTLHWVEAHSDVDARTGRVRSQVRLLDKDRIRTVAIPLRNFEAPFALHTYPSYSTFTLTLFRTNDVPARVEILQSRDYIGNSHAIGKLKWSQLEHRAFTDSMVGVAFVAPDRYVIPVQDDTFEDIYSLRLFRHLCEWAGSVVVYEGSEIDSGFAEYTWTILPHEPDGVLVVSAADATAAFEAGDEDAAVPWYRLDLETGALERTAVMRDPGAWAAIPATDPGDRPRSTPECDEGDYAPYLR